MDHIHWQPHHGEAPGFDRVEISYPERRMVTKEKLALWAMDAVANGDTSINATDDEIRDDFNLVRLILDDSGYATIVRR